MLRAANALVHEVGDHIVVGRLIFILSQKWLKWAICLRKSAHIK